MKPKSAYMPQNKTNMEELESERSWSSASSFASDDYCSDNSLLGLELNILDRPLTGKHSKRTHFLKKLFYRELRGSFALHQRAPVLKPFEKVPESNQICLSTILPTSAFHSNHVFLGLSKCGQFLLSYTYTADMDVVPFTTVYKYRLHWWVFVPHKKARKVAEVMLFGDQGVYSTLYIAFCQWPTDYTRVLVYGNCYEPGMGNTSQPERSYITITTVPSLNKCLDCSKVAASFEEEDLAASWDSCLRPSCLKHGLTIHTTFDVVSPYPKFNPHISLKFEGAVLINTGSLLHVLKTNIEHASKTSNMLNKCHDSPLNDNSRSSLNETDTYNIRIENQDVTPQLRASLISKNLQFSLAERCIDLLFTDDTSNASTLSQDGPKNFTKPNSETYTSKTVTDNYRPVFKNSNISERDVTESGTSVVMADEQESLNGSFCSSQDAVCSPPDLHSVADTAYSLLFSKKSCSLHSDGSCKESTDICFDKSNCNTHSKHDSATDHDYDAVRSQPTKNLFCNSETMNAERLCSSEELSEHSSVKCLKNLENLSIRERIISEFSNCIHTGQLSKAKSIAKGDYSYENGIFHIIKGKTLESRTNDSVELYKEGPWRGCSDVDVRKSGGEQVIFTKTRFEGNSSKCQTSLLIMSSSRGDVQDSGDSSRSDSTRRRGVDRDKRQRLFFKKRDGVCLSPRSRRCRVSLSSKLGSPVASASGTAVTSFNRARNKVAAEAEKAYEFTDDSSETSHEKLSSFRRRRLADKKYEFCEEGEDAENIVPYRLHRGRESSSEMYASSHHFSPVWNHHYDSYSEPPELIISNPHSPASPYAFMNADIHSSQQSLTQLEDKVLRPLNRNMPGALLLSPRDRDPSLEWNMKGANKKPAISDNVTLPESNIGDSADSIVNNMNNLKTGKKEIQNPSLQECEGNDPVGCAVELNRRFFEVDDELVSVITDIEDDDLSEATGYHNALPLEVHGAGYAQMQMISNSKAEKLMAPCVLIQQRSFDVEKFCHEVSERLCEVSGKKYWFCNDYDVEIVDVCPFTGDVIALTVMMIEATVKTKGLAKSQRFPVSSTQRKQYQGGCTFVWNMITGNYAVVYENDLVEVDPYEILEEPWNPARDMARKLRDTLPKIPVCQQARFITNHLALKGVSLECFTDLENMIGLVLQGED